MSGNGFKNCWEYFNCSESTKKQCSAFHIGRGEKKFTDCYIFIKDCRVGGPAKNGPCAECEWYLKYGPMKNI